MNIKKFTHTMLSCLITLALVIGLFPAAMPTAFAAQQGDYRDPAENWLTTGNRISELDINAKITDEMQQCSVCEQKTLFKVYRVPEYTRSGGTALNRGVLHSDGTMIDGVNRGNVDSGVPGVNSTYTGYHWTKAVCTICGTLNSLGGEGSYGFKNDVYNLYDCAAGFMVDLSETKVEQYNYRYHTEIIKSGQYCQFCHGTHGTSTSKQVMHDFHEVIDPQIGNQRFDVRRHCDDCDYSEKEILTAKTVVTSYYGEADGKAHTVSLADLSDSGVVTSIRYGNSADKCNLTSAPNYVAAGYYDVYYAATYNYGGENMTENGVAYVQLYDPKATSNGSGQASGDEVHVHDYRYIDTVQPTCTNLGWENWQCQGGDGCGALLKTNYRNALNHNYRSVTVRTASCTQSGLTLNMCNNCGDFYEDTLPMTTHNYAAKVIAPTCKSIGYTEYKCTGCGHEYTSDMKPLSAHSYYPTVTPATCTDKGYTTHKCGDCGDTYVDSFTNPAGHNWNIGETLTSSTCEGEGIKLYTCLACNDTMMQATNAGGHRPGGLASCTQPQRCLDCFTILAAPVGHTYSTEKVPATCTKAGYTIYSCIHGDDSHIADYTEKLPHRYGSAVTAPTCLEMGFTTYTCADCSDTYKGDYTNPLQHSYRETVTAPTCTAMGFTTYICFRDGDTYVSNYTNPIPHDYKAVVTAPTCTALGFTTYTCKDCGDEYTGNVVDKIPHNFTSVVTPPTCTELGFTTYTCKDCGFVQKGDFTNSIPHNYRPRVTEPTCLEMGYTTFFCTDCDDTYKGSYTNPLGHDYHGTVTEPTCTSSGFTTFVCSRDGDSYIGNYTDITPHKYEEAVTPPTCTELGFSIFTCSDCGDSYRANEVNVTPHRFDPDVTAPTCTSMGHTTYTCLDCGELVIADYTDVLEHGYITEVTEPTCTAMGFTTFTCPDCNATHTDYYTEILPHDYDTEVTAPTCLEMGYTTYNCPDCHDTKTGDYTNPLEHDYHATVTAPTCTAMGFTTFDCSRCDEDSYIGNYIEPVPHNYASEVTEPTCLEMGFTVKTCPDCGDTKTEAYTDALGHDYVGEVTAPTCSSMGFTTYTCSRDGDSYIGDYVDPGPHNSVGTVTAPTCTAMGYTTFTCSDCGESYTDEFTDLIPHAYAGITTEPTCIELGYTVFTCEICGDSYKGEFIDAPGHTPSDWIIDAEATMEADGSKHIECLVCGFIIKTVVLKQLNAEQYTDNDGRANVGKYTVILTDKDGIPVPHTRVTIDVDDNIGVELTDGRLLDYADGTTVTVIYTATEEPAPGLNVFVNDENANNAIGVTDDAGQVIVPASSTSTGDTGNGTVGGEDEDGNQNTYVVTVNDFYGVIIDDCGISIGEDGIITVKLPEGTPFDRDNPVTVTVTDQNGKPLAGLTIVLTGDGDVSETGETNSHGRVTLPLTDRGYTNDEGKIKVNDYIVIVEDTQTPIAQAFVTNTEDGQVTVLLPEPYILTTDNQITVTVLLAEDESPVKDMRVTVFDYQNRTETDITNIHGKILVPALNNGYTDEDGFVRVNGFLVYVEDETSAITGAYVVNTEDGTFTVLLPGTHTLNNDNRTTITILYAYDETPAEGMTVIVTDCNERTFADATDKNGKVTVPPVNTGYTDEDGQVSVDGLLVTVADTVSPIEGALVTHSEDGKMTVLLPDTHVLDSNNQTTVTVIQKLDSTAVKGMSVTVTDKNSKSATKSTDTNGKIVVPDKPSTGGGGSGGGGGYSGGGGGGGYIAPKPTPTPAANHTAYIVGYSDGTFKPENAMTRAEAAAIFARLLAAKNGDSMSGRYSFPDVAAGDWYSGYVSYLKGYGIIVGYEDGTFRPDENITRAEFVTMAARFNEAYGNKALTNIGGKSFTDIPGGYWALSDIQTAIANGWIVGYPDGTFRGESEITRAEAVAVVNRSLGRKADTDYISKNLSSLTKFTDISSTHWAYYDVMEAANAHETPQGAANETWTIKK